MDAPSLMCSFRNCRNNNTMGLNKHFYRYPTHNESLRNAWIENAGRPDFVRMRKKLLRKHVVCDVHFEKRCFTTERRNSLMPNAVPTLHREYYTSQEINILKGVQNTPAKLLEDNNKENIAPCKTYLPKKSKVIRLRIILNGAENNDVGNNKK